MSRKDSYNLICLLTRFYILSRAAKEQKQNNTLSDEQKRLLSDEALAAYSSVVQIGCMRLPKQSSLSMAVVAGIYPYKLTVVKTSILACQKGVHLLGQSTAMTCISHHTVSHNKS
jgi:hypothetical protein